MDNQETFDKHLAQDFILDELERTQEDEEKLVRLYEYLQLLGGYDEELKEE